MFRSPLAYIAMLFCIIFSCTSDIELPPPPLPDEPGNSSAEESSSSNGKVKPSSTSQPDEQSSSSKSESNYESSSSQTITQSSSSSIAGSNLNSSSSSTLIQGEQSSSSEQQPTPPISSSNSVQKYMADDVYCVSTTGDMECKLNGKVASYGELKLTNSSEGCMDIEMDWQNQYYPGGSQGPLDIMLECNYRGSNNVSKICKLISNGKELKSETTNNPDCQIRATSIGKISGVSDQFFNVCIRVFEGGEEKYTDISCRLQVYKYN